MLIQIKLTGEDEARVRAAAQAARIGKPSQWARQQLLKIIYGEPIDPIKLPEPLPAESHETKFQRRLREDAEKRVIKLYFGKDDWTRFRIIALAHLMGRIVSDADKAWAAAWQLTDEGFESTMYIDVDFNTKGEVHSDNWPPYMLDFRVEFFRQGGVL